MSDDHKYPEQKPSQTLLRAHATCTRVGRDLTLMPNHKLQISPSHSNSDPGAVAIQENVTPHWRVCAIQILTHAYLGAVLVHLGKMAESRAITSFLG